MSTKYSKYLNNLYFNKICDLVVDLILKEELSLNDLSLIKEIVEEKVTVINQNKRNSEIEN